MDSSYLGNDKKANRLNAIPSNQGNSINTVCSSCSMPAGSPSEHACRQHTYHSIVLILLASRVPLPNTRSQRKTRQLNIPKSPSNHHPTTEVHPSPLHRGLAPLVESNHVWPATTEPHHFLPQTSICPNPHSIICVLEGILQKKSALPRCCM